MEWQFEELEDHLAEVFDRAATEGPQKVNRRGGPTMIIAAEDDYAQRVEPKRDFVEWLFSFPDVSDLDLERDKTPDRDIVLE